MCFVVAATIGFILPLLISYGLNEAFGEQGLLMAVHSWLGLVFMGTIIFQFALGIYSKLKQ
jgi:hypothetical protein